MNLRSYLFVGCLLTLITIADATAVATPAKEATMTWQAWVTISACIALLIVLALNWVQCVSAMVTIAAFLFLVGIIEIKDVFQGLANSSVVTICMLFIIVDPIAELPLVQKFIEYILGDLGSKSGIRIANFKIIALCLMTSSFFNNAPQVAMLTNLIKNHCRKVNASPSQLLMPMNFATLCGNYAIIGTSTNLIVDGLMTKAGMKAMPFFELIKITGPFTIVMMWYLVFAPAWILPEHKGGLFRTIGEQGRHFLSNFRVKPESPLIGQSIKKIMSHYARWLQDIEILQIHRSSSVIFPINDENRLAESDIVLLRGDITNMPDFDDILGLAPVILETTGQVDLTTSFVRPRLNSTKNEPTESSEESSNRNVNPETPVEAETPMREILSKSFSMGASLYHHVAVNTQHTEFYEVVIGNRCPHVGSTVGSNHFQVHYSASILAVRDVSGAARPDLFNEDMSAHLLCIGDTLLILGRSSFRDDWTHTGDFILINEVRGKSKTKAEEHFARFPAWFPFGNLATVSSGSESSKKVQCRLVAVPYWYEYTSLPVFGCVIGFAVAGYDISVLALLAVIYSVTFGLTTSEKALSAIDYEVYVMVAFSFSIGTAMEKSGFAEVLGTTLKGANVSGLSLLYLIAGASALMTNVITNKACVQVLVPLVISTYRLQGKDPLPGVMLCCALASMALSTPYGFATNLMVMGPGGYTAFDFIKFGVPLNILAVAICPIICYAVYA